MMMKAITREWFGVSRSDEFVIAPIGDMHVGNASADAHEKKLRALVERLAAMEHGYTLLMGDMAEYIGLKDKRFDPKSIAPWIRLSDLTDIAAVQSDRVIDILMPLIEKDRILGVIKGNHESSLERWQERDISYDLAKRIKEMGGKQPRLLLGMSGWVVLKFHREKGKRAGTAVVKIFAHHGFVGGRLAGAKALNMQRLLWNHGADIVYMGHDHTARVQPEAIEEVDNGGNVVTRIRYGCSTGNWLGQAQYAKDAGYFPLPVGYVETVLRPRSAQAEDRMRHTPVTWG